MASTPPAPQVYDFGDWEQFYEEALDYHNALHPNDQLVIDRIDTFRSLMSRDVIRYLNGLVRRHPRFNTTQGWDQWVESVSYMLSVRQLLPNRTSKPITCASLEEAIAQYKNGKLDASNYWQALDECVCQGLISSAAQREVFWSVLRKNDQDRMVAVFPSIDTQHFVRAKREDEHMELEDQHLSLMMMHLAIDKQILMIRKLHWVAVLIGMSVAILVQTWWTYFSPSTSPPIFIPAIVTVIGAYEVRKAPNVKELARKQNVRRDHLTAQ